MNRHDPKRPREVAVFKSNRNQAVRIPKEFAFPDDVKRVQIIPVDEGILIKPIGPRSPASWADYFRNGPFADPDFMAERDQGDFEDRETLG
jgi:antitoxin VapB